MHLICTQDKWVRLLQRDQMIFDINGIKYIINIKEWLRIGYFEKPFVLRYRQKQLLQLRRLNLTEDTGANKL